MKVIVDDVMLSVRNDCTERTYVADALALAAPGGAWFLPVVNPHDQLPIGVVEVKGLRRINVRSGPGGDPRVGEAVVIRVPQVRVGTPLDEITELIDRSRAVLVVDENGRLRGLLEADRLGREWSGSSDRQSSVTEPNDVGPLVP